jgi:hypothetical protein
VDDVSISLEHVDLLNSLDGLNIELLERRLQLLVVHTSALVDLLDLSSRCALSAVPRLSAFLDLVPSLPIVSICRYRRFRRKKTQYIPYR